MKKVKLVGIALLVSVLVVGLGVKPKSIQALVPGVNSWVSLDSSGNAANNSSMRSSASGDGRYVSFTSWASNLVSGDINGVPDVFMRDTTNNTTVLVSQSTGGTIGNVDSDDSKISYDGRYVVFDSSATNLVSGDTNGRIDVFVRDTVNNTTTLVSASSTGTFGNGNSANPDITADGRFIVFGSSSTNLNALTVTNSDIYLKDILTSSVAVLSTNTGGTAGGNGASARPSISCDGGVVAFQSAATNLVASDTNAKADIFLNTRGPVGTNTITNITSGANDDSDLAKVSCNGNYAAYHSRATNIVAGDTNSVGDLFNFNRLGQQTTLVSVSSGGTQGNAESGASDGNGISGDGKYLTYFSGATNLVSGDTNSKKDVFVYNMEDQTTQAISISGGTLGDFDSSVSTITANGKYILYQSSAKNLVSGDTNVIQDIYKSETGF